MVVGRGNGAGRVDAGTVGWPRVDRPRPGSHHLVTSRDRRVYQARGARVYQARDARPASGPTRRRRSTSVSWSAAELLRDRSIGTARTFQGFGRLARQFCMVISGLSGEHDPGPDTKMRVRLILLWRHAAES